jgi:Ca2+-binding EF-hand superfamily protein
MQRATWQDESEVFGNSECEPEPVFKRNINPWEVASLNTVELCEQELKRQAAENYKIKAPWTEDSIIKSNNEIEEKLKAANVKIISPWDEGSQELNDDLKKAESANDYNYKPIWDELKPTSKRLEQIAGYKYIPPYKISGNEVEHKQYKSRKTVDGFSGHKQTLNPWEHGSEPADPIHPPAFPKKQTSLWSKPEETVFSLIESSGDPILDSLRLQLQRRGANGLLGLSRKFRIMDDDNSGTLDESEFKKGMKECKIADLSDKAIAHLFRYFDRDDSGSISYDEFLVGIRGQLNKNRAAIVDLAFDVLDKDGSGLVDIDDIKNVYDTSRHPDVIHKLKTKDEILKEILMSFEGGKKNSEKDGIVDRKEFQDYYANVSASIDNDEYFELMIRNAWHISGGEGAAANTTNLRVLVTHEDGTQTVEEIKNDIGLKASDKKGMVQRLRAQGINAAKLNTNGAEGFEDGVDENNISNNNLLDKKKNQELEELEQLKNLSIMPKTSSNNLSAMALAQHHKEQQRLLHVEQYEQLKKMHEPKKTKNSSNSKIPVPPFSIHSSNNSTPSKKYNIYIYIYIYIYFIIKKCFFVYLLLL